MKALAIIPIGLMTMLSSTPAVSHHDGRIDGALSTSLTGQAVFGPVKGNQSSSFSLELGAYSDNGAVVFSRVSSERPRAGTYRVTAFAPGAEKADEFHAMISLGSVGSPIGAFRAVSGTVTILQSTGDRIVGRYEVKAVGFLASDPENEGREITVRGGFSAEPAAEASRFEGADGVLQDRQGRRVVPRQLRGSKEGNFESRRSAHGRDRLIIGGQNHST